MPERLHNKRDLTIEEAVEIIRVRRDQPALSGFLTRRDAERAAGVLADFVVERHDELYGTDPSLVADLSRDDRTGRITTAIANTCDCADITVTVREADGTEAPLRRLARCLDGAGLIDHEGI